MTVSEFKKDFTKQLSILYPKTEIDTFFSLLIEECLGIKRIDWVLNPEIDIPQNKKEFLITSLNRLLDEEPIQYIIGKTEFYGLPFYVNQHTLIPRPETEELVSQILKETQNKNQTSLNILDIGTGSGCIAVSLKKHLINSDITAIDISSEAIKMARKNAKLNKVSIQFIEQNILNVKILNQSYDYIVSNPPYVREMEKKFMHKNVLEYEPKSALFVQNNNPLLFYKKISSLAKYHLKLDGALFFEINEYLGNETKSMIERLGFRQVEIKKDIFGKDRMIKAIL